MSSQMSHGIRRDGPGDLCSSSQPQYLSGFKQKQVYVMITLHAHCRLVYILGGSKICSMMFSLPMDLAQLSGTSLVVNDREKVEIENHTWVLKPPAQNLHISSVLISLSKISHVATLNSKGVTMCNRTACPEGRQYW